MLNYETHASNGSMYNTPSTYAWYLAGLVFKWLKDQGGLEHMEAVNLRKAELLYSFIDSSDFYSNPVDKEYRSLMNISFTLANSELNEKFLDLAATRNLVYLKGHKSVGGMRASIYNAMPEQGVVELVDMMQAFEKEFG